MQQVCSPLCVYLNPMQYKTLYVHVTTSYLHIKGLVLNTGAPVVYHVCATGRAA